jgi:hypothetical protein
MNGSASAPSSATMNGTRWAMRPAMNATSRESRAWPRGPGTSLPAQRPTQRPAEAVGRGLAARERGCRSGGCCRRQPG